MAYSTYFIFLVLILYSNQSVSKKDKFNTQDGSVFDEKKVRANILKEVQDIMKIDGSDERNNALVNKIFTERHLLLNAIQQTKTKDAETQTEDTWDIKARSAIEVTEDKHGRVEIQLAANETADNPDYFERNKRVRAKLWRWMFANQKTNYEIKNLMDLIQTQKEYPNTTDDFANAIATAFQYLSDRIHSKWAPEELGIRPVEKDSTSEKKSKRAIEILLTSLKIEYSN